MEARDKTNWESYLTLTVPDSRAAYFLKRRLYWAAIGKATLGVIYGFLLGLFAWAWLPIFFARQCFRDHDYPWKLK